MKTNFFCEICAEPLNVDKDDSKTYSSIREENNLLMGKLFIIRTVHENNNELHYNVVVADETGAYRAHQDSYSEPKPSMKIEERASILNKTSPALTATSRSLVGQKHKVMPFEPIDLSQKKFQSLFLGRVAILGQGGSGKTRAIQQIANELAGKDLYPWSEEKNIAGTLTVTPYALKTPSGIQVVMNDNPGQSSLDLVRQSVAMAGANYAGIVIFTDSTAWNFKEIGVQHALLISQYITELDNIPVLLITSKTDLNKILSSRNVVDHHASLIADVIQDITPNQKVAYFDRVNNQAKTFNIKQGRQNSLYFTQLEQLIVNTLQVDHRENNYPGFSQVNIRLYVRSLLLGFCDLVLQWMTASKIPDIYPELNAFDENLINALNYYRPTAYETNTTWKQFHGEEKNEPPIIREAFDRNSIRGVIQEYVLGSKEKHQQFLDSLTQYHEEYRWNVIGGVYTNSVTEEGRKHMLQAFEQHFYSIAEAKGHKDIEIGDLGLDLF
ncbi:MAG: Rab family GTPase [Candidatus Thorarchaeota archaeon]